jgi:D-xylose reductase
MQLDLWGLDYFDLFLVHFPIALAYVEPNHRYPPEWWGDDGKVHLRTLNLSLPLSSFQESLRLLMP